MKLTLCAGFFAGFGAFGVPALRAFFCGGAVVGIIRTAVTTMGEGGG